MKFIESYRMPLTFKNISRILLLLALAWFSFLMLRIMFKYIPVKNDVAFLLIKQDYIENQAWRFAFFVHVFSSILTLFAGFTQFSSGLLKRYPKLHRICGYLYVLNVLVITGPASLLMAFYANGGITSRIAFVMLAVLWWVFTALALWHVRKRNFKQHRNFMIRSYAFTLSAVTLRIWKVILAYTTSLTMQERYQIIAWLGFIINWAVAEWIIYRKTTNK